MVEGILAYETFGSPDLECEARRVLTSPNSRLRFNTAQQQLGSLRWLFRNSAPLSKHRALHRIEFSVALPPSTSNGWSRQSALPHILEQNIPAVIRPSFRVLADHHEDILDTSPWGRHQGHIVPISRSNPGVRRTIPTACTVAVFPNGV